MKNKIKKSIQLLGIFLFLTTISCENDSITESESHDHSHGKAPNEVSFDFFRKTTKINDVDLFLKEKISENRPQSRNANYSLSDFFIDTTFINQCVLNDGGLSFSFRIYPTDNSENPDDVYNLVVSKIDNEWETSIFLLAKNSTPINGKLFSSIEKVYQSAGLPNGIMARTISGFAETTYYHCTNTGKCKTTGRCDMCKLCVTTRVESIVINDPEKEDDLSLQDPIFTYNDGGGGGSQTPTQITTNPNPCEGITEKVNNPDIKTKIVNLKTPAVLNLNYEKGFDFIENAAGNLSYNPIDGNPGQTGINFTIDSNGNTVGFIHSHFDKPNMSPIFTIEDVRSFNAIDIYRGIKRKSRTNTCLMLVSRAGVFALVIEDFTLMKNYGDKLHDPIEFEELKNEYNGDLTSLRTDDDVIKQVLQVLPKYGVGLYKANDNLDGWNKLTYNSNTNSIVPTPCN